MVVVRPLGMRTWLSVQPNSVCDYPSDNENKVNVAGNFFPFVRTFDLELDYFRLLLSRDLLITDLVLGHMTHCAYDREQTTFKLIPYALRSVAFRSLGQVGQ